MAAFDLVQSTSGNGTQPVDTTTAGNLLVVTQAHRDDLTAPEPPGAGWTQRVLDQFQTGSGDRRGIVIWDKEADGTETEVDFGWGAGSDLGGIFMEFEAPAGGWVPFGTDAVNSGTDEPATLTCPVPPPATVTSLAVAAAVARGAGSITQFDSGFNDPPAAQAQTGAAYRTDAVNVPDNDVTVTHGGDESNLVTAVYVIAATWEASGVVTNEGVPVEGARVLAVTGDEQFEQLAVQVATTDAQGAWSAEVPEGLRLFAFAVDDDGTELFTSLGHGFVGEPE